MSEEKADVDATNSRISVELYKLHSGISRVDCENMFSVVI